MGHNIIINRAVNVRAPQELIVCYGHRPTSPDKCVCTLRRISHRESTHLSPRAEGEIPQWLYINKPDFRRFQFPKFTNIQSLKCNSRDNGRLTCTVGPHRNRPKYYWDRRICRRVPRKICTKLAACEGWSRSDVLWRRLACCNDRGTPRRGRIRLTLRSCHHRRECKGTLDLRRS